MATTKQLQTRIALKYDTYANWTDASVEGKGANLVLLKGEIGLCEIPNTDPANKEATTAPTVLFKVGDGTSTFSALKWASAKAADVYGWAKSETVVLDGTTIKFKTGDAVNHEIDLSAFETTEDAAKLAKRITDIEAALGLEGDNNSGSVSAQIEALSDRLDVIEGTDEGSIARAAADTLAAAETDATTKANKALGDAKTYTDGKIEDINEYVSGELETITSDIETLGTTIDTVETEYKAADEAINAKIGTLPSDYTTLVDGIAAAKQAGLDAAADAVEALQAEGGKVHENAEKIAKLEEDLNSEIEARTGADSALDERLAKVEAFFEAADHDGEDGGLNDALDTLVEIQSYLNGEGSAAGGILDQVQKNATDIGELQTTVGGHTESIAGLLENVGNNADDISDIQDIINSDNGKTIRDDVTALQQLTGDSAKGNEALRSELTGLQEVIADEDTGLAATKDIADAAYEQAEANEAAIAGIKETVDALPDNYLALADLYVLSCGDSVTNIN